MSVKRAPSAGLPTEHRRAVIWIGVLTLLLSLLTPLISLEVADATEAARAAELAQGVPPDCEPGFVVSDDGTACVEDPNAQLPPQQLQCDPGSVPDETGTQCVPDPSLPPQCDPGTVFNEQTGFCEPETLPVSVQLTKYECPADASGYQQDYNQLSQSCFQPTQPYNMWHIGPDGQDGPIGVQGYQEWTNLTPGQHAIGEQIPEGLVVSVWCTVYDPATGPTQGQQYQPDASGQVSFDVPSGYVAYCDWYNIPPGGGTVTVYKWDCVEGTEYGRELAYYQGGLPDQDTGPCETEHLNIPISLIHGGPQQDTTTQANGTQFDNVILDANGGFQIAITEPEGYGDPMVWCWPVDGDPPTTPIAAPGGTFTVTPGSATFSWQCVVYDLLTPNNSITVYKWDCAPGTDYGRELEYYQGGLPDQETGPCESEHLNVPISLIHGGPQQDTTTQANGTQFDSVILANGSFQIAIDEPDGYGDPGVFCATLDEETQQPVTATGGAFTITPASEPFTYQCNVYDIPISYGQIQIEKYWCPPGLAFVQEPTQADYQGACQETGPQTSFSLSGPAGPYEDQSVAGNPGDSVLWSLTEGGQYTVTENVPEGEYILAVFCHLAPVQSGNSLEAEEQEWEVLNGNSIQWTAEEGYIWVCAIFNQPTDTGSSVTVYKWDCIEGTEYGQTQAYYQGEGQDTAPCETEHLDVPISLIHGGPQQDTTTQANGTQFDSVVLANGSFQIAIDEPDGYGDPMVFCGTLDDEAQTAVAAPGGTFTITPATSPFTYQCNVYDILAGDNSITVYKWDCEPGTQYGQSLEYYQGGLPDQETGPCESEHLNIPISLFDANGERATTTQANGTQWDNVVLNNGSFQVAVTEPDGYGDPVVFCATVDEETQEAVTATGGQITITPASEPFTYHCNWYDIPAAADPFTGGGHWVTIIKYYCSPETQPSDDLALMQEACTEYHNGVPFSLQGGDMGNASEQTTVGGAVEWTDLAAGTYTVTEDLPPGYGAPLVWCGYIEQGGAPIELASQQFDPYTPTEGAIQLQLEGESSRITCYWYNFGGEETTVTVYKYDCDASPPGYQNLWEWQQACPAQGNDYTFTLTDSEGTAGESTTADGSVSWEGVPEGTFTLRETLQPGWGEPVVWCGWTAYYQGAIVDAFPQQVTATGGVYQGEIPYPGTTYFCYWFNIPVDHSSVTVYKYVCPEGYLEGVVDDPLGAYQQACTTPGNGIQLTLENDSGSSSATVLGGVAKWSDVPLGEFTITETVPPGYEPPLWFCGPYGEIVPIEGASPTYTGAIDSHPTDWVCYVFNFPNQDRTVTVYKWLCPEGYQGATYDEWLANCTMPWDGVSYTLTDVNGNWTLPTVGGMATWYGTGQGDVTLDEHIPPGYFEPVVYCSLESNNGSEGWTAYTSTNGAISRSLDYGEYEWICNYFNLPKGPGEITIYKWLCPPGYDFYGWGANPTVDCTTALDDVTFTLDQPVGPNLQTNTGDSIPGAVYFGGLDPGDYVVTETVPSGVDHAFVLNCTGSDDDKVHPYPLMWGNTLPIRVAGGDSIVCHWYNVPPPDNGWITVYKYQCWTTKYTSAVDCELYEYGATFELFGYPGNTSHGVGTTNAGGLYTWNGLEEGAYTLDEISHKPCKITATKTDGEGHAWVDVGQGTVIKVYNCKSSSITTPTPTTPGGTPPKAPGKVPGKYPNTGVVPESTDDLAPSLQPTPFGTPTPPANESPEDDYYRISCLEGTPVSTPAATETTTVAPEGTQAATSTPEEFDLPIDEEDASTPAAGGTPDAEEDCARGALPERVVVDAAQVDAEVETLEIVDGIMEQPTGPELVAWYKETGRLGEPNNVVIAGHLNYWNVPEGVFFYLSQLQEGDRVEITGDDGLVYVYEVQWVRQESNLAPPAADVIGPTDEPSLTLITCGGEWNAGIAEYDERTVARAVQVDVIAAEDAADEAAYSPLLAA